MNDNMTAADMPTPRYTPFDWDFGTAGMEDDADTQACIYCGAIVVIGERRHCSDGTVDHACYSCARDNGWIDDDDDESEVGE